MWFAGEGLGVGRPIVSMSLFAAADEPQPARETQVIELYDRLRPSLLTYLGGLGLTLSEAEDVVHNLAMDLFREGRQIHQVDAGSVDPLDMLIDPSFSPEDRAIRNEEHRRMWSALGRLTEQQRSAVLLRAEELRYREIAEILGVSVKRVSELVQRALARLAGDL
jgi:RNA polymerase sigma factor (sigma-70 family)